MVSSISSFSHVRHSTWVTLFRRLKPAVLIMLRAGTTGSEVPTQRRGQKEKEKESRLSNHKVTGFLYIFRATYKGWAWVCINFCERPSLSLFTLPPPRCFLEEGNQPWRPLHCTQHDESRNILVSARRLDTNRRFMAPFRRKSFESEPTLFHSEISVRETPRK